MCRTTESWNPRENTSTAIVETSVIKHLGWTFCLQGEKLSWKICNCLHSFSFYRFAIFLAPTNFMLLINHKTMDLKYCHECGKMFLFILVEAETLFDLLGVFSKYKAVFHQLSHTKCNRKHTFLFSFWHFPVKYNNIFQWNVF